MGEGGDRHNGGRRATGFVRLAWLGSVVEWEVEGDVGCLLFVTVSVLIKISKRP